MSITADELAKVHHFYMTEGAAYSVLAEDLGREVERLRNEEAAAAETDYLDELSRIQYDAECAYALDEHGAQLSGWDETTEFQRGVTTAGVSALLTKLEADGRLVPAAGSADELKAAWDRCEIDMWPTWEDVPEGFEFKSHKPDRYEGTWIRRGDYVFSTKSGVGYVITDSLNNLAPFVRADSKETE